MARFKPLEISWHSLTSCIFFTPNLKVCSERAETFVELPWIGRRVIRSQAKSNAETVSGIVDVIEVEVILGRRLLDRIIEVVQHSVRLHKAIEHDYEDHDETHDHTAVRLQLWLSIFE